MLLFRTETVSDTRERNETESDSLCSRTPATGARGHGQRALAFAFARGFHAGGFINAPPRADTLAGHFVYRMMIHRPVIRGRIVYDTTCPLAVQRHRRRTFSHKYTADDQQSRVGRSPRMHKYSAANGSTHQYFFVRCYDYGPQSTRVYGRSLPTVRLVKSSALVKRQGRGRFGRQRVIKPPELSDRIFANPDRSRSVSLRLRGWSLP